MNERDIYRPMHSIALSSSAGSGKTFALTTRLISMLMGGISPSDILAITFTNLAANEIRNKLFERISSLVQGDRDEVSYFSTILNETPEGVIGKASRLKRELIRKFSLLQISTIHSFFASMVKSFPYETGLSMKMPRRVCDGNQLRVYIVRFRKTRESWTGFTVS
jgi:ATP-dependent helicase/nuclease subunit A